MNRDLVVTFSGNEIKANHFVRGSQIGNSSLSISETDGNNDAQIALHPGGQTFGILTWDAQTYLSSGVYYSNGVWVHQNSNNNNQMFVMNLVMVSDGSHLTMDLVLGTLHPI